MTQNASTRGETACLQSDNAFFNFTEAIRDNSSLFKIGCGCGHVFHAPAARTAGRAEAIWPHNQIRCPLFGKIEHRIQFGLRCGGCSYPPGPDPICPRRAVYKTAFYFIQINFKRCNVCWFRWAGLILPAQWPFVKSPSHTLLVF